MLACHFRYSSIIIQHYFIFHFDIKSFLIHCYFTKLVIIQFPSKLTKAQDDSFNLPIQPKIDMFWKISANLLPFQSKLQRFNLLISYLWIPLDLIDIPVKSFQLTWRIVA